MDLSDFSPPGPDGGRAGGRAAGGPDGRPAGGGGGHAGHRGPLRPGGLLPWTGGNREARFRGSQGRSAPASPGRGVHPAGGGGLRRGGWFCPGDGKRPGVSPHGRGSGGYPADGGKPGGPDRPGGGDHRRTECLLQGPAAHPGGGHGGFRGGDHRYLSAGDHRFPGGSADGAHRRAVDSPGLSVHRGSGGGGLSAGEPAGGHR